MKGYLLQERAFTIGEETFVDSNASENNHTVVFEDDTETGYFYAAERTDGEQMLILDSLHIYNVDEVSGEERNAVIKIIWSQDWQKCALVINNYCHAVFDFELHGGYSRNEFPPPNDFWTKDDRILNDERIAERFM